MIVWTMVLDPAVVAALTAQLGPENVLIDAASIAHYAASTGLVSVPSIGSVRPASTAEVQAVVAIAADRGIRLYPVSRGRNWGYGDSCPVQPNQLIVDLSRMNAIREVDDTLGYAVIEAGVTQGQLSAYLAERYPSFWCDCTGAGPDVSIVGNVLERGFGHSPYGNRAQTVCGMEIVLPDSRILKTGTGRHSASRTVHTYPYGVGPFIDGLFTQSNFGIVTSLGIWLMPVPEETCLFLASSDDPDGLAPMIDGLRELRLEGTVNSIVHIGNDMRLISSAMSFPFHLFPERSSLPADYRAMLRRTAGLGEWTAVGALHGDRRLVAAARRRIRSRLHDFHPKFLTRKRLDRALRLQRLLASVGRGQTLGRRLETASALFDINTGKPSRRFMAGAYWRRRGGIPADLAEASHPAADGCSFLWLSPTAPATGRHALELRDLVAAEFEKDDFDFFVTMSLINERTLGAVVSLCFDGDNGEERSRAGACYDRVFDLLVAAGFVPYRVSTASMDRIRREPAPYWDIVRSLKRAIDPQGLIAPGRYTQSDG
ncbi:MAG: FAD-binding protein [Rhodospirillaceae bacterium]